MKGINFVSVLFIVFYMCCTSEHYIKNGMPQRIPKEVPAMVLISGMEYFGGHTCEGSTSTDSLEVYIGSFYMSKHEITNKEFCSFLNEDSIRSDSSLIKEVIVIGKEENKIVLKDGKYYPLKGYENYPVVMVSWWGARKYCEWLTALANKQNTKKGRCTVAQYRLPSEYEWIYAASDNKKQKAVYIPACNEMTDSLNDLRVVSHDVKKDSLIQTGLTGMNENVYEWTEDNFYKLKHVLNFTMTIGYYYDITENAVVRKYGSIGDESCGRISRLRTGFYSDTGFRIVQTQLGRSSGFEF